MLSEASTAHIQPFVFIAILFRCETLSEEFEEITPESSDDIVRNAREVREKQIQDCSQRAAEWIVKLLKSPPASRITTEILTRLMASEFSDLNG
jgi:hypothetical protein